MTHKKDLQKITSALCVRDLRNLSHPHVKMLETVAQNLKDVAKAAGEHQEVVEVIATFVYTCSVILDGALEDIEQQEAAKIR